MNIDVQFDWGHGCWNDVKNAAKATGMFGDPDNADPGKEGEKAKEELEKEEKEKKEKEE